MYGNVLGALMRKGVGTKVGYEGELSYSTDTDGSNRFDSLVVYKFVNGYALNEALRTAKI